MALFTRSIVHRLLRRYLADTRIEMRDPRGLVVLGQGSNLLQVVIWDMSAYRDWLLHGTLGFSRSWLDRKWDSPEVDRCAEAALRALGRATKARRLYYLLMAPIDRWNLRRADTSPETIARHYEGPQEIFRAMLGPELLYSTGVWFAANGAPVAQSLAEAEDNSVRSLLQLAEIGSSTDSVLDLGCGWGAVALAAAASGAAVDATTVSDRQAQYVEAMAATRGFDNLTVIREPYDAAGPTTKYDALFCIEVAESIHPRDYTRLGEWVRSALAENGVAVFQFSGVASRAGYTRGRRRTSITHDVFEGATIVARDQFEDALVKSGLMVRSAQNLARDYVPTLEAWKAQLQGAVFEDPALQEAQRAHLHFLDGALGFYRSGHGECWRLVCALAP